MSKTLKAGAIIMRKDRQEPEVLLIYRNKLNDWSFPKGHCEEGETNEETMIREVLEETGLSVVIQKSLPDMEYQNAKGDMSVAMFLAVPLDEHSVLKPEYQGDRLEWIPMSDVERKLSYQNLKEYFIRTREEILREIM
jgi:8-oxo-dGTP diphosphatase